MPEAAAALRVSRAEALAWWPAAVRYELADGAPCVSLAHEARILSCANLPVPSWPGDDAPPAGPRLCAGDGANFTADPSQYWMLREGALPRCEALDEPAPTSANLHLRQDGAPTLPPCGVACLAATPPVQKPTGQAGSAG